MVLLFPVVLGVAGYLAWKRRATPHGKGWRWFLAWIAAGFLLSFSFITGLSIGLIVFPFAAASLLWVASRSPHFPEAWGFAVGIGGTALLVLLLNYG
jgi:hypothetical protein